MEDIGEAISQRVVVLAIRLGQMKRFCDRNQHLLTCQCLRAICILKMLLKSDSLRLQFGDAKSPNGLHHIDRNRAQQAAACRVFLALIVALMGRAEHVNIHGRVETVKKRTQLKKFIFLQGLRTLQSHVPAPN